MRLSILGLYEYNEDVFANFSTPDGIDTDTAIAYILNENEGLTLLRPDYDFMQTMIGYWCNAESAAWAKLQETVTVEYNPVYNYDRYEETTDTGSSSASNSGSSSDNNVDSQVAFNTDDFKNTTKRVTSGSSTQSGSSESKLTHSAHMYGNIGVTTAMQMIKEQREVADWNIYQFIAESFKRRFCIEVY